MIENILIGTTSSQFATAGGSLIHPFGPPGIRGCKPAFRAMTDRREAVTGVGSAAKFAASLPEDLTRGVLFQHDTRGTAPASSLGFNQTECARCSSVGWQRARGRP